MNTSNAVNKYINDCYNAIDNEDIEKLEYIINSQENKKELNKLCLARVFNKNKIKSMYKMIDLVDKEDIDTICDQKKNTPLLLAAKRGQVDIAKKLIERGANIEMHNSGRWRPLSIAVQYKNVDLVSFLIEQGAYIDTQDFWLMTPLMETAASTEHCLEDHIIAEILLKSGADVDIASNYGTVFDIAKENKRNDIIDILDNWVKNGKSN